MKPILVITLFLGFTTFIKGDYHDYLLFDDITSLNTNLWHKTSLTWFLFNYTDSLGFIDTYNSLDKAFKEWESISTLEFKYLFSMNADILIYFVDLNHNIHTGDHNFPSTRVLAHAFYPIYDSNNKMLKHSGDIH